MSLQLLIMQSQEIKTGINLRFTIEFTIMVTREIYQKLFRREWMIETRIERSWAKDGFDLWIFKRANNKCYLAEPINLKFKEMPETFVLPSPTIEMHYDFAIDFLRSMAEELKRHGYNVFEPDAISKELKSTKYHLEDMRKLVFNKNTQ